MTIEEFKEELHTEFTKRAYDEIFSSKLPQKALDKELRHFYKFNNEEAKVFIDILTENLYQAYQDLSKINKELIIRALLDLWSEHRILYQSLENLEEVAKEVMGNDKSLRSKVEAIKVATDIIKLKESLRHRFIEYIKNILELLIPHKDKAPTPPIINIKYEGGTYSKIEIIQDPSMLQKLIQELSTLQRNT